MPSLKKVLSDIDALKGRSLASIRPGADLVVQLLNYEEERIVLRSARGKIRSRPFSEIEAILQILNLEHVAHVDSVLGGSGSSRNQPETILANLPYVEFTFFDNKKHLVLRERETHSSGTLMQMDQLESRKLADKIKKRSLEFPSQIIIADDLSVILQTLKSLGGEAIPLAPNVYRVRNGDILLWVVKSGILTVSQPGAYLVLRSAPLEEANSVGSLDGVDFCEHKGSFVLSANDAGW